MDVKEQWYLLRLNPVPWRVGPVQVHRGSAGKLGAHIGRDQELAVYQQAVKSELIRQGAKKLPGRFAMTVYFWREISTYKTPQAERARNQEADGTNLYKAVEDACHEVFFDNDRDNACGEFVVVDQAAGVEGRIVVHIREWKESSTAFLIASLPMGIYQEMTDVGIQRVSNVLEESSPRLAPGDDEYGADQDIF